MSKILNHGGESFHGTTLGFKFLFKRFVLAMKFTVMLFERLVTCACLMDVIASFQSPLLVYGSISIVPFTHLVTSCNKRTASEHVLGRHTTVLQDWSNGSMNVTVLLVAMCNKGNDVLLSNSLGKCFIDNITRSVPL